jgi:hypothetical protein
LARQAGVTLTAGRDRPNQHAVADRIARDAERGKGWFRRRVTGAGVGMQYSPARATHAFEKELHAIYSRVPGLDCVRLQANHTLRHSFD